MELTLKLSVGKGGEERTGTEMSKVTGMHHGLAETHYALLSCAKY